MSLKDISFQKYIDSARNEFNSTKSTLSDIERDFQNRMNGESIGKMIGAMFCTIIWIAIFNVAYWLFHNIDEVKNLITISLQNIVLSCCFCIAIVLLMFMFIDELMLFFHYEKFSSYTDLIKQINHRVNSSEMSLASESDKLLDAKSKDYNVPIDLGLSVSEESSLIKECVNGIDSIKRGKIEIIKNILFFTLVVLLTGFSLWIMLEPSVQVLSEVWDEDISVSLLRTFCIIAMIIVGIGEIILSVVVWNATDCSVKNLTLLILLAGPVLFILFAIVICLLVFIVMLLGTIIIGLLQVVGYIAIAALVLCCCCGG